MPVTPTYPGVYIEELPSGVHTITGVATSIAAFIDFFTMGPMNEAVQILSFGDFERQFGGLNSLSEASYAIQQFFLNGGSEAWVVRVASSDGAHPAAAAASVDISNAIAGGGVLTVTAIDEGQWGDNLRAEVDSTGTTGQFNLTLSLYQTQGGRSVVVDQEVFRNLSMTTTDPNFVETVVNDDNTGSALARVTASGNNPPLPNGTISAPLTGPLNFPAANPSSNVTIGAVGPAAITLTIAAGNQALTDVASALEAAIRAGVATNPEFSGATVDVVTDAAGDHLRIMAGPGGPSDLIVFANDTLTTLLGLNPTAATPPTSNVQEYTLGNTAAVPNSAQLAGAQGEDGIPPNGTDLIGVQAIKTGIFALEDVDLFNLLCIPRTAMTASTDPNPLGTTDAFSVITVAEQYCESRRAFFLMDSPSGVTTPTGIKNYLAANDALRDKNAALYYPRVDVPDQLNSFRLRSFGASGTIAGLCARTDSARGVWKAPAGTEANLVNVPQLDYNVTDGENGVLNPLAINCLRNFPVFGNVCWGARTLEGADQLESDWKYVPVRRFTLFLEESLYRGTKWVVFEPNDEPLWAQIRLNIGAFLQSLFRQGAFQGKSSREAYFVKCDSETTTQTDINNGIVNIVVGFAPLKPAEFVIIQIQQIAGQIPT
jgi:Bacteriophage tail sheath protein